MAEALSYPLLCPEDPLTFQEEETCTWCIPTSVYDGSRAGAPDVRASSREPLMEVFCTHAKCVALKPVGEMKKGLVTESKMTKPATNRRDTFSKMIIVSGQLTENKCSLAPCEMII